jgi:hypothetical protein
MVEWVVERLIGLIPAIAALGREKRELKDQALQAISHAINETYLYYRDVEQGGGRNPDVEAQLSRHWAAAAIPIRHIDSELAQICEFKSEYWVNPDNWNKSKIKDLGIGLESVRMRYRSMIRA